MNYLKLNFENKTLLLNCFNKSLSSFLRLWLFYDYNRRRHDDHDNDHNDYNNYNDHNHNICWSGYNDNDAFRSLFWYKVLKK